MVAPVQSRGIRIVAVDDHPVALAGIRVGLKRFHDIRIDGEALDGATGLKLIVEHRPDVALIDVWLPDMDGFELTERVRELSPRTRVVIISGDVTSAMRARVAQLGIEGFFQKTEPLERLAGLIRQAGRPADFAHEAGPIANPLAALTLEEQEVVSLLAAGETLARIAAQTHLTRDGVNALKRSAMGKLGIDDHFALVRFARREVTEAASA